MIAKERNPAEHPEGDKFSKAGAQSEEQLAFYLKRSFVDSPDVFVINDLRLKDDTGDAAQIDHLVLHRHGFVVIESKSVSTSVKVNKHGEWSRVWNGHYEGMSSPIQQAKRQIEFLRRALNEYREQLVGKMLGFVQMGFQNCPFEILVAVSDHGTIAREVDVPEVVKADQVPDRIRDIIHRHKLARNPLNLKATLDLGNMDGIYNFSDEEMQKIVAFFKKYHLPVGAEEQTAKKEKPTVPKAVRETPPPLPPIPDKPSSGLGICPKCGKQAVIIWGGHNYFWKCPACEKNFPIKEYCPTCRQKMMLRKDKNRYFIYCGLCKTPERLYCEFVAE